MENIVDIKSKGCEGGFHCWGCHQPLAAVAVFCNNCGVVQPVREMDHFRRLGLDKRIDIDMAQLDRNLAQLQRTFTPERFIIRGATERGYAGKHREAIKEAAETLRDPIARSRYWIDMHKSDCGVMQDVLPPIVNELKEEFARAEEAAQLDRLAQRTGQEIEFGIMKLLNSLRTQAWNEANEILVALNGMEILIAEVREKRQLLTPHGVRE